MKYILTLEADTEDELREYLDGPGAVVALHEVDTWLRSALKYGHKYASADEALDAAREFLRGTVNERRLEIDG